MRSRGDEITSRKRPPMLIQVKAGTGAPRRQRGPTSPKRVDHGRLHIGTVNSSFFQPGIVLSRQVSHAFQEPRAMQGDLARAGQLQTAGGLKH